MSAQEPVGVVGVDPSIAEDIRARLGRIEVEEGVRILFAVESGSRAWGFASRDSDYDVRFVYVHPPDWYLAIDSDSRRDVVERPIVDHVDLAGWELRKALRLFARSNPPLLEWLGSPIVYVDTGAVAARMRALLTEFHSPTACAHHYLHMAEGNLREYLRGDVVWVKKYFYVLRPVLAARWIEQGRGPVPMLLTDLYAAVTDRPDVIAAIEDLRRDKLAGAELDRGPAIPVLSEFLASEVARLQAALSRCKPQRPGNEPLDRLFRAVLRASWG